MSFSGGTKITINGKGFLDVGEIHVNNMVSYLSQRKGYSLKISVSMYISIY